MQPVQLSLIPDPNPTPAMLVDQLPPPAVAAAIALLATVIAKASTADGSGEVSNGE